MKVIGVIPARYNSSRFPGKPLAKILGKPMIQLVYEKVKLATQVDEVIVATDHEDILKTVKLFGGEAVMTDPNHESGSDRIAEVASNIEGDIFINVQGDEPLIQPELIDNIVNECKKFSNSVITAKKKIEKNEDVNNPNIVKVITNKSNDAIYFSRSPIPYNRSGKECKYYKHLGIYCYPREILEKYVKLPSSQYETLEMLEQLRLIENDFNIKVVETNYEAVGVDTPDDIKKVEKLMEAL